MNWQDQPGNLAAFCRRVFTRFNEDRCTRHAAALSFNTLLALAPMIAIAFAMLSMFAATQGWEEGLEQIISRFLVPTVGAEIQEYLATFAGQAGRLTAVGLVFFLITALMMLFYIEESFNDIWRVHKGRPFAQRVTVYWAMVTMGPLLMGASLSLSTYLVSVSMADNALGENVTGLGLNILPFVLEVFAFAMLYTIMPNVRVSIRAAVIGAVVATILFEFSKKAFSLFVVNFDSYEIIYGALATIPIFLIWVYVSWLIALIGAEVVAELDAG
jgi:membrane protein